MGKIVQNYISGLGQISFGMVNDWRTASFGISIGNLKCKPKKIDSDVDIKDIEELTVIWFKNIEGLEVLQDKVDRIRMELVEQNKTK